MTRENDDLEDVSNPDASTEDTTLDDLSSQDVSADDDNKKSKGTFFPSFNKSTREVKQSAAGAGFVGLIGFGIMLLVASVFFITENYFISMFTISIGLLIYVTGLALIKLMFSSFIIFFSSKHLNERASNIQQTLIALQNELNIQRGRDGSVAVGLVRQGSAIRLPDNPLSRDIQEVVSSGKNFDYAEFVAHSYYVECHELYESSTSNFDFVSSVMPLFGLIGTIIGLIIMFDSLGSDVTVESLSPQLALALKTTLYGAIFSSIYRIIGTRFERRMVDLDYDYETFCRALQVIMENKNTIEVE
ncbi:MotA/TolQ/ExbB proton channel family protein [Pleionea sediminis]|uniref:MotA/TolQ/ExbB proton channel family protein n=1 Tax=Pleionea sediminis TaxID=2569479 RepID=UPI0011862F17|nr:MotA/TolQ/ExbB proton channel family protein [Pleionea sediminis]